MSDVADRVRPVRVISHKYADLPPSRLEATYQGNERIDFRFTSNYIFVNT